MGGFFILESNRDVLVKQYSSLLNEITSDDDIDVLDVNIINTPNGEPTICVNGVFVHSQRDPLREGQRLAEAIGAEKGAVVVLGFGLGYAAVAAAALGKPVIIVEKYKSLLLKAFELRDFSDFLSKNKLIFIVGGSGDGILNALSIANDLAASDSADEKQKVSVIRNRALTGLDEQWYRSIEDKIRTWSMKDDVNTNTFKRFGQRWVRNLSRNMSAVRDLPGVVALKNFTQEEVHELHRFSQIKREEDIPVFLAAAGPSLDRILPIIKEIHERCIIVAVDTSLRFFTQNGIAPDFVVVVDPQFWNSRHLDRCLSEEVKNRTVLIAESAVYPPVLNLPFKNKFLCGSLFPLGAFIERQVDPKGTLAAGGSVATTAWDFARLLGARQIWIAGLDLAFPNYKTHFHGARFEELANSKSDRFNPVEKWVVRVLRDGNPFKARSSDGGQVLTDQRLSLYAAWFENQFRQNTHIQNYALFQEGLAIAGLQTTPNQAESLLALPKRRGEIESRMQEFFLQIEKEFNAPQEKEKRSEKYNNAVDVLTRGLNSVKSAAEEGIEIVQCALARSALRNPQDSSRQNKVLKELDSVMRRLMESEVKEVVSFLMPSADKVYPTDKLGKTEEDEKDPFCAYLKSSLRLFENLAQVIKDVS